MSDANKPSHGRPPPAKILRLLLEHQRWINTGGRYGEKLDKDELLLEDLNLDGIDFSGAELRYACFLGGTARAARFAGANLQNARFASCDLEGADFSGADLWRAVFLTNNEKASFEGANTNRTAWSAEEEARNEALDKREREARFASVVQFMGKLDKGPG